MKTNNATKSHAMSPKQRRGMLAYAKGKCAEAVVAEHYKACGFELVAERWRGEAGEIDLIVKNDDCFIFVEVKSSSSHEAAASHLSPAQLSRLCLSAQAYMGAEVGNDFIEYRLDAALVDAQSQIQIIENISL